MINATPPRSITTQSLQLLLTRNPSQTDGHHGSDHSPPRALVNDAGIQQASRTTSSAARTALRIDTKTKKFGSVRTVRMSYALPCGLTCIFLTIATAVCGLWAASLLALNEYSMKKSTAATISLAQMVDSSTSANIQSRLYSWLHESWALVTVTAKLHRRGSMSQTRLDEAYWQLLENTRVYDYMTGLAIADDQFNTFVGIQRFDSIIPPTEKWYYHIDPTTGRPISPAYNKKTYNFRTRGWYRNTTLANATTWTDLYTYTSGAFAGGISLCEPLYTSPRPEGQPSGVVALDVTLQPLTDFLNDAMNQAMGTAYLMDSRGRLLGTSTGEPVIVNALQISAHDSVDFFTRETARRIQPYLSDPLITSHVIRDPDFSFSFRKVSAASASGLVIVAGRPATTYTGPIETMQTAFSESLVVSIRNTALITTSFVVLVSGVALFIIHRMVIVPLKHMRHAIMKASELEFKHMTVNDTMVPSKFDELNALQYAFRAMCAAFATGLRQTRQLKKKKKKKGGETAAGTRGGGGVDDRPSGSASLGRELEGSSHSAKEDEASSDQDDGTVSSPV
ncbi:hypothetical protein BCR44DRAFT_54589 [Catenaria anguillulae PL171]|uniref:Uncharacterized protein n=1 Tax=Catenaria anguillulae PL171 TaxID=765915 RepID=A0A1Y2HMR6_9FUNG|nr:hypothetical protein BCR44DRAFT_54589 [Catenaria anguillulae PL171]